MSKTWQVLLSSASTTHGGTLCEPGVYENIGDASTALGRILQAQPGIRGWVLSSKQNPSAVLDAWRTREGLTA